MQMRWSRSERILEARDCTSPKRRAVRLRGHASPVTNETGASRDTRRTKWAPMQLRLAGSRVNIREPQ